MAPAAAGGGAPPQRRRPHAQRHQRLHEAETARLVVGQHARRHAAAGIGDEFDALGFQNQVADGQHDAVVGDEHTRAAAFAAQRARRTCAVHRLHPQADDGLAGAFQCARTLFDVGGGQPRAADGQQEGAEQAPGGA